ncbi:MAG: ABC transporter permease [Ramlibacter sp.]|nr:ABC transporter permease [Ramlibacter sp.]
MKLTAPDPSTDLRVPAAPSQFELLKKDVLESARLWRLWAHLGWGDIRKQYRRSFLGPMWISLNTAIFIVVFGLIGAQLFSMPVDTYVPYFCAGHVIFTFFSSLINEGCQTYIASDAFLKQTPYPKMAFVLRVVWRNLIMLAHNLPIVLAVLWWAGLVSGVLLGWFIVGLALSAATATLVVALLGAVAARFRDVPMIVGSVMQIAFFVTPVMWLPQQLTERARLVVLFNPLAAFLELLRAPILGQAPRSAALVFAVATLVVLALLYLAVYLKVRRRIVYWL